MGKHENKEFKRLHSLDILRGVDMFWIMGGKKIFVALAALTGWPFLQWWSAQLEHVEWHGFAFYDMIFPLFLFIAGVSFPFSCEKRYKGMDNRKDMYRHIIKRGLLLVLLGIIYNNAVIFDFANMRYGSVLGRIGLAWMFTAIIFANTRLKSRIIWFWGLLIVYWLLLLFSSVHNLKATDPFSMEGNLAGYIDRLFLPGKLYNSLYEPQGYLSTIPAVSKALLGMFTGELILSGYLSNRQVKKVIYMILTGVALIIAGKVWNLSFPINKKLWSSSFVCFTGGISLLLFGFFYMVIDIWNYKKWTFFFVVIGMNSITIYLLQQVFDISHTADFLFGGFSKLFPASWGTVIMATAYTAVGWILLYVLYRKKIFLKV